jgi:RNA polymerase sigma-70 factor, ECF subfamily
MTSTATSPLTALLLLNDFYSVRTPQARLRLVSPAQPDTLRPSGEVNLESLFVAHGAFLHRLVYALVGRQLDAEDIVQDVFVEAMRQLPKLNDGSAARGWLSTIATRMAVRRLKRRRWRQLFFLDDDADDAQWQSEQAASSGASPESLLQLQEVFTLLDSASPADRVAWVLRVVEQKPLEEVAAACRCSLATVKRRIARVEHMLKEAFP